jgi:hypothetical protein
MAAPDVRINEPNSEGFKLTQLLLMISRVLMSSFWRGSKFHKTGGPPEWSIGVVASTKSFVKGQFTW